MPPPSRLPRPEARLIGTWAPRPPYDFGLLLRLLARCPFPVTEIVHQGALWRVLRQGEALALVQVTATGPADAPVVQATLAAAAGPIVLEALREQVADWLAVDGDRATLSSVLAADERLSAALRPVAGLPLLRTPTALEALVNTVIEQHIAWRMALKAQRWLVTWHNVALSAQEHTFYAYPSPEHLAAARPEDLLPLKITRRRVQVILHLARLCAAGELAAGALRQADEAAAYARLCALPGIGHWSAAVALLRLRGAGSFIPHTDVALQAAAARYVFGRAERLPPREVVALLRPLAGQAGAAVAGLLARYVLEDYGVAPER